MFWIGKYLHDMAQKWTNKAPLESSQIFEAGLEFGI